MNKTTTIAVKRIMDTVGKEIEKAFSGEFKSVEEVSEKHDELHKNLGERLNALKDSKLFTASECDDIYDFVRCKLSGQYCDARFRTLKQLRDEYVF